MYICAKLEQYIKLIIKMVKNKEYASEALKELIQATVAETLAATGQDSGEISQAQAKRLYGRWFKERIADGSLRPVNAGKGNTSTKWYSVVEIRSLRAAENIKAEIQSKL